MRVLLAGFELGVMELGVMELGVMSMFGPKTFVGLICLPSVCSNVTLILFILVGS